MASLEDLYSKIPTAQIAQQLGIDEGAAQNAIQSLVPQLLGGLHEHAQDPEKEATLHAALEQPQAQEDEGHSLVSSLFGSDNNQVAAALSSGASGVDSGLAQKLLPILLPIVISYISQKSGNKGGAAQQSGGGLGDLIGGILGGSGGQGGALGNVLGSVLGGALGGGSAPAPAPEQQAKPSDNGGVFGKILGGLLNRNK